MHKYSEHRNLVIVRAGDSSLHPHWLEGQLPRNWDLLVSYFGSDSSKFREAGTIRDNRSGPKWPALKSLLSERAKELSQYEYIFMPDDDLDCTCDDINRLFDLCRRFDLILAQPSLSVDSYVSHAITIHNPSSLIRFTNWVEIMAPLFHRSALNICQQTFCENLSGWGLCTLWPHLISQLPGRIGIVDGVQVKHTRPIYGPNYDHLKQKMITPEEEMLMLLKRHSLKRPLLQNLGVVDVFGREYKIENLSEHSDEWLTMPWGNIL
jgi:hypothetical protein